MGPKSDGRSFFAEWTRENATTSTPDPKDPVRSRRRPLIAAVLVAGLTATALLPTSGANADPSAHTWYRLRVCESGNRYAINTGNGHYGAYQFDLPTWRSVGGSGYPNRASKPVQDARALILYRERGWEPWTCARILGLRPDRDARSGRTADIHPGRRHVVSTNPPRRHVVSTNPPRWPGGSHWYYYGQTNRNIKRFQDQMHARGFFPVGTGEYGPHTLQVVKRLQRLNGLIPNGYLGPNTWQLAWIGRYSPPGTRMKSTPEFPGGSHWYHYGETNRNIKRFQDQMHARGFFPVGTGEYGPHTLQVVKRLQRLNGLVPNGLIGPNTWRLAWIGRY